MSWPPTTPAPAKTAGKTAGQWSRPGTSPGFNGWIRGVRPPRVEPGRQGEAVVAGLGARRVEAELPGVVPGAEEPGVLARPGQGALDQAGRQGHATGDAVAPAAQVVEHGRIAGEIVAR